MASVTCCLHENAWMKRNAAGKIVIWLHMFKEKHLCVIIHALFWDSFFLFRQCTLAEWQGLFSILVWYIEFYILFAEFSRFIFRVFNYFSSIAMWGNFCSTLIPLKIKSCGSSTKHRCTYINVFSDWDMFPEHWLLQTVLWSSRSPTVISISHLLYLWVKAAFALATCDNFRWVVKQCSFWLVRHEI